MGFPLDPSPGRGAYSGRQLIGPQGKSQLLTIEAFFANADVSEDAFQPSDRLIETRLKSAGCRTGAAGTADR